MEYSTFGRHLVVDVWGVAARVLDNVGFLQQLMLDAAENSGATVLSVTYNKFDPSGCTILILLAESHFSIHTYPEKEFAAIDCYTCGSHIEPQIAVNYLTDILKPKAMYMKTLIRGLKEIEVIDHTKPLTD